MLKTLLSAWQTWGLSEPLTLITLFTEGKNHHTCLIESGGQRYVLKQFNHSIDRAMNAQEYAAQHLIAPKVVYRDSHIAIMENMPGGLPSINSMAIALSTLHEKLTNPKNKQAQLTLADYFDKYLVNASSVIRTQHTSLQPILHEFLNDSTPMSFCHNDLVNENCLSQDENAMLIDWEYAAPNNPWFDLASVVLYRQLDSNQASTFLAAYRDGWQDKINDRIFLTSQVTVLWLDLLWHSHQYGPDYRTTHDNRFNDLTQLLNRLTG